VASSWRHQHGNGEIIAKHSENIANEKYQQLWHGNDAYGVKAISAAKSSVISAYQHLGSAALNISVASSNKVSA